MMELPLWVILLARWNFRHETHTIDMNNIKPTPLKLIMYQLDELSIPLLEKPKNVLYSRAAEKIRELRGNISQILEISQKA
jgi:hypothetical protein